VVIGGRWKYKGGVEGVVVWPRRERRRVGGKRKGAGGKEGDLKRGGGIEGEGVGLVERGQVGGREEGGVGLKKKGKGILHPAGAQGMHPFLILLNFVT